MMKKGMIERFRMEFLLLRKNKMQGSATRVDE
jgi:hypothetical protein